MTQQFTLPGFGAALERERTARLTYRRARATKFLELKRRRGITTNDAWQMVQVDPALQRLEDEYEDARGELEMLRAMRAVWARNADADSTPDDVDA